MGWCAGSSCCHRQLVSRDDRSAVDLAVSRPSSVKEGKSESQNLDY